MSAAPEWARDQPCSSAPLADDRGAAVTKSAEAVSSMSVRSARAAMVRPYFRLMTAASGKRVSVLTPFPCKAPSALTDHPVRR